MFVCRLGEGGGVYPFWGFLKGGVTGGVTKWGYIFRKVGLQIWGFGGGDRVGGTCRFEGVSGGKLPI